MKKVYLAGGWFTSEQEEQHTRIYNAIKDKFDVFNPRIEGEITTQTSNDKMTDILCGNIEAIRQSDVVVVLYNFKDTGTIWEAGYAYANKKPIIYFDETDINKPFNLMLAKTGRYAKTQDDLLKLLYEEASYTFKYLYDDFKGEIE